MQQIKIQFILGQLSPGGSERHVVDMASSLDRERFTPLVTNLRKREDLLPVLKERGVDYTRAPIIGPSLIPGRALKKEILRFQPDVVCVYTYIDRLWGRMAAFAAKVPVVLSAFRTRDFPWYEPWLLKRTTAVLANSRAMQQEFRQRYDVDPAKVRYLPNGIDLSRYSPRDRAACRRALNLDTLAPDTLLTAMVARFDPVKDHATALAGFRQVAERMENARLALVGYRYNRENAIRKLITDLGLADRVELLPTMDDVGLVYGAADLVLLTSRSEGMPRVLVEAQASARPVLATRVGGCAEVVLDGKSGYLVEPASPGPLAEKWLALLGDAELRERMGQAGQEHVLATYTREIMVERFQDMVTEMVLKSRS